MAKRFSDTEKWKKKWFRRLSPVHKVFWEYVRDNCNHAGIWDVDFELAQFQIGAELRPADIINSFKTHISAISKKKWFILDFIPYQYGCSIDELNPNNRVHQSVLTVLAKYDNLLSPLEEASQGAIDIDKDKSIVKEQKKVTVKNKKQHIDQQFLEEFPIWLDEDFQISWKEHREVRKKKKGALTQRADWFILTDLNKLSGGNKKTAIAILDQSARKGWIDVFALKENNNVIQKEKREVEWFVYECYHCLDEYYKKELGNYRCPKNDCQIETKGDAEVGVKLEHTRTIFKKED